MTHSGADSDVAPPAEISGRIERAEHLYREGHTEVALSALRAAAAADPTPAARIALALMLAQTHPRQAIEELEQAWDQGRRLNSPRLRALCCGNLSVLSLRLGDVDQAARYRQYALSAQMELAEQRAEATLPIDAFIDLAVLWLSTPEEATWAESLLNAAAAGRPDFAQQAEIASHRGVIAARSGRDEEALVHWAQAQRQFREVGETAGVAHTMLNLGHVLQHRQRSALARRAFLVARELFDEQNQPDRAITADRLAREAAAHARVFEGEPAWN